MCESAVRLAAFLVRTANVHLLILLILFPSNLRADVVLGRVAQLAGPSYAVAVAGGDVYVADHAGGLLVMQLTRSGDLNCDGEVNGADIDPFFLALGDPAGYAADYPQCNHSNGDMNGDGRVNGADIDRFFACLGSGWCP